MAENKRSFTLAAITVLSVFLLILIVASALLYMLPGLASYLPQDVSPLADESEQVAAMEAIIEQLRFLLGGLALGLTGIVAIQAAFQARHDRMQQSSVQQVSEVLTVVKETLKERLDAEKAERRRANRLRRQVLDIKRSLRQTNLRLQIQDEVIAQERRDIELRAGRLAAHTSRHHFRDRISDLESIARQFDMFKRQFAPMEQQPREFTSQVLYIRGIAAHYANDPTQALRYLQQVIKDTEGAERRSTAKRVANAYYYLGITHSNFGHMREAAASFEKAIETFSDSGDYLTRVVYAEAVAMGGQLAGTASPKADPEGIVKDIDEQFGLAVPAPERRLRSRAILIIANTHILDNSLEHAANALNRVLADDPGYYYARCTLAQVLATRAGSVGEEARELFQQAYDEILRSDHLITVTEARSKVLLHMTAALCLRHGMDDRRHADEQLDAARAASNGLPELAGEDGYDVEETETCTVFSALTKKNEKKDEILRHIEAIANGEILRPGTRHGLAQH